MFTFLSKQSLSKFAWCSREVGLGAHDLEQSVGGVWKLNKETINATINIKLSFVPNCGLVVLQVVILELPWVHCKVQRVHFLNES